MAESTDRGGGFLTHGGTAGTPCLPLGEGGERSEPDEGRGALTHSLACTAKRNCSPTLISLLRCRSAASFPEGKPRGLCKSALPRKHDGALRGGGFLTHGGTAGTPCLPLGEGGERSEPDEGRGALTDSLACSAKHNCSPTLISLLRCRSAASFPEGKPRDPRQIGTAQKERRCLPAGGASPSPTLRLKT